MHKAIWCVLLRGEDVSRAADRLHKPFLLHKRQRALSNCQNLYFKDCDRSAVWGSPSLLCLRCLCTSSRVLCERAHEQVCVCFWHLRMHVCAFHIRAFMRVRRLHFFFWQTFNSDPFYWSLQLSVNLINRNMPGQEEKRNCYTSWDTMTASLPREALEGSPWAATSKRFQKSATVPSNYWLELRELWFVSLRMGRISSNYNLLQLCLHCSH